MQRSASFAANGLQPRNSSSLTPQDFLAHHYDPGPNPPCASGHLCLCSCHPALGTVSLQSLHPLSDGASCVPVGVADACSRHVDSCGRCRMSLWCCADISCIPELMEHRLPGPREGCSAASYHIGGETLPPGYGRPPCSPSHYAQASARAAGLQGALRGSVQDQPPTSFSEQALQSSGGAGAGAMYSPHTPDMGFAANSAVDGSFGDHHHGHQGAEPMALDSGATGFPCDGSLPGCDGFMEDEDAAGWLQRSFHNYGSSPYN